MSELPDFITGADIIKASGGRLTVPLDVAGDMAKGVTAMIRRYCGWHVAPVVEETLVLDYDGGGVLTLPTLRVEALLSLTVDGVEVADPEWSRAGDVRLGARPAKWQGVQARVQHGYPVEEVADLRQVAVQAALVGLASPMGVVRESSGQVSIEYSRTGLGVAGGLALMERDMRILDAYRLPRRA
ncbi:MAG: hypothetical protein Q4D87_08970 [Actinomycetaceae bacterium]|nr:hypothetical protein [Actinomycetaceae bacterium]